MAHFYHSRTIAIFLKLSTSYKIKMNMERLVKLSEVKKNVKSKYVQK
jgi:hypothetical protein